MESTPKNRIVDLKRRTNYDVVMRALLLGIDVELVDGLKYRIIKSGDPIVALSGIYEADHDILCIVCTSSDGKIYTLPAEISMNSFLALCDTLSEKDRIDIIMTCSLIKLSRDMSRGHSCERDKDE